MSGEKTPGTITWQGVTFESVKKALTAMYFWKPGLSEQEQDRYLSAKERFVVPMKSNIENPLRGGRYDTFIQYWIDEMDRLTQDRTVHAKNTTYKTARISLRFIGVQAELWAAAFHRVTARQSVHDFWLFYCGVDLFEYIGPIVPIGVDYFNGDNAAIAFDIEIQMRYAEVIDMTAVKDVLSYVAIAPGLIIGG